MLKTTSKVSGNTRTASTGVGTEGIKTGKRALAALLLSSSAASALALALAATVSTTIATPANAQACVINHTGAPWTITCYPGNTTASDPNTANNGWPGTNDYTSQNSGIVVTVLPGASVTPQYGSWYFGNSGNASADSGGPFVFTLGNATVPTSLNGNIYVGGNVELTTNSANFTNFGNITGGVGLGVSNGCLSRMGGPVTFYNGPAGVIGGNVTVYSGTIGAGPSGTQNFNNTGVIHGTVLLDTAGSVITGCTSSANFTGFTLADSVTTDHANVGFGYTTSTGDTFSTTHNGGFISATNSNNVGGGFNIYANDGGYLNNSANITGGPVNVIDSVDNSWTSSTYVASATSQQSWASGETTSTNGQTVTYSGSRLGTGLIGGSSVTLGEGASSETVNWSHTIYTSVWSAGNIATLINTGNIGNLTNPFDVTVNGDKGASASNGAGDNIFGSVTVTSINRIGNSTSTWVGNALFGPSFTTTEAAASSTSTEAVVYSPNVGSSTASFLQSSSQSYGATEASTVTFTNVSTTNYLGGNATLVNNGNITGGVTVTGVSLASLTNTGFIGDPNVYANFFNTTSTSIELHAHNSSSTSAQTYSISSTTGGNLATYASSDAYARTWAYSVSSVETSAAFGGTATFTNSGYVGAGVGVYGQALATLNNSGNINGGVNVSADNYTKVTGGVFALSGGLQSSETETFIVNTGGNSSYGAPGTLVSQVSAFNSTKGFTSVEVSASAYTISAGTAIFTNSGNITGYASVEATGNATLVNSGHIPGDVAVVANWDNTNFSRSESSVETTNVAYSSTYTLDTSSAGNFVQSSSYNSAETRGSSDTFTVTSTETTTNGVASLVNSGNATIGGPSGFRAVEVIGQASALENNSGVIYSSLESVSAIQYTSAASVSNTDQINVTASNGYTLMVNTGGNASRGAPGYIMLTSSSFGSAEAGTITANSSDTYVTTGGNATLINSGNITGSGTVSVVAGATATLINSGHMLDPYVIANSFNTFHTYTSYDSYAGSNTAVYASGGGYDSGNITGNTSNFLQTYSYSSTETYTESYGSMASATSVTTGGVALLTNDANSTIGAPNNYTPVVVVGQASAGLVNSGTIYSGNIIVQALSYSKGCMTTFNVTTGSVFNEASFTTYNTGANTTLGAAGLAVTSSYMVNFASAETSTFSASDSVTYTGGTANLTNTGVIDPVYGTLTVFGMASAALTNSGNITESNINVLSTGFNSANATSAAGTWVLTSNENDNTTYSYIGNATVANTYNFGNLSHSILLGTLITEDAASAGGTALLNNSGYLVGGNSTIWNGPTVTVNGDTSATLINSGNIEPFAGNRTAGGVFVEVTSITGNASLVSGCVSAHAFADAWTYSAVSVTTGNATPSYWQTSVTSDSKSWLNSSSQTFEATYAVFGGVASLSNSGNIAGSASVDGGVSAALTNSGFIGESFGTIGISAGAGTAAFGCVSTTLHAGDKTLFQTLTGNLSGNFVQTSARTVNLTSVSSDSLTYTTTLGGANVSLVNSGIIGIGNKTLLTSTAPMDILLEVDGTATANNSGTIFGCLTMYATVGTGTSAFSTASVDVSGSAENTYSSQNISGNLGNVISTSWTSLNSQSWTDSGILTSFATADITGGAASLTNTGGISGDVSLFAGNNASLINTKSGNLTGVIVGNVTVSAQGWDTYNTATSSFALAGNTSMSEGTSAVTDTQTTKFTSASSSASTSFSTSVESNSYQNVTVSNATTASLVNDGTIGVKTGSVNVNVVADGSTASAINTGTIWGNLSVSAYGFSSSDSYSQTFNTGSAESSSSYQLVESGGNVVSGNVVLHVYAPFTATTTSAYSRVYSSNDAEVFTETVSDVAAAANVTNSGKIVGSVFVDGQSGTATLTNSGNITGVGVPAGFTVGSVDVVATGAMSSYFTQFTSNEAHSLGSMDSRTSVQNLDSGGNVISTIVHNVSTEAENDSSLSVFSLSQTSVATGGTAVLVNTATGHIGVPTSANTYVSIDVMGGTSASLVNSGLIWAQNINVLASLPSVSSNSLESFGSTATYTSAESSTYINNSTNLPGNATILPSYYMTITSTASGSGASSGSDQITQTQMTLGGAASLVNNSGGIIIAEAITVAGDATASLVNSGIIGPEGNTSSHDYVVISNATNSVMRSLDGYTATSAGTATYNEAGTLNGTTLTVTTLSAVSTSSSYTSFDSFNLSQLTSGGNASLVNNAGAIIGGYPVSIFVTADQTASVINMGEIDGNVSVVGYGYSLTSVTSSTYFTGGTTSSSDMLTTITGNLVAANMSFSYNPTSVHIETYANSSGGSWSTLSVTNVISGVGTLTNASGASITGNVTVSGPYGASLVNSGTIGGGNTSGGVIAQEIQVFSFAANMTYSDAGNYSQASASSETYSFAKVLGSDANLTATYSNVGGNTYTSREVDFGQAVTTQVGTGATLTNNSSGVIGSLVNPMTVIVDAVGPSTVVNNGTIYGDLYIGVQDTGLDQLSNSSTSWVNISSDASTTQFSNTWSTVSSNLTGSSVTSSTGFANITTTNFTNSRSYSSTEVVSTVAGPASYSGTGNLYGGLNLITAGNIAFSNSGNIGSPFGGGSVEIVSTGSTFLRSSLDNATSSGNTTDANISSNGISGTHSFNGMSSGTETQTFNDTTLVTGGTVSFSNSGRIGGNASNPIFVFVNGPSGTTATNSGTIYGDLEVESDNFYNSSSSDTITQGYSDSTTIVTNYSSGKVTTESSTTSNSSFYSSTMSTGYTPLGGNTSITNTGTITGEVTGSSAKNVLLLNSGSIWQSVSLDATGDLDNSVLVTGSSTLSVDVSSHNSTATTTVLTTVSSTGSVETDTHVSSGGNATLINSGSIGHLVISTNGGVSVFTTDPVDGDAYPNVYVSADQYANVSNTGNILGSVYETITGANATTVVSQSTITSETMTVMTTTGVLAGAGSSATTVTVFGTVQSYNLSQTSVETGGTATLINSGNIGQSFAGSQKSGGCLTATGGVYLQGMKGATIINSGLIGGDAQATAEAYNSSLSIASVETVTGTETIIQINTSLTNTATTRSSSIDIFHATSTSISVPTGGSATITNTGSIGIDELNAFEQPVGTGADIIADGQAGAAITNSGVIQGRSIEAYSHWSATTEVATDDGTLTETFDTSIGGGVLTVGGTEVQTYTQTILAGGGTATITNSGKMLSTGQFNYETDLPQTGTLQVIADSYGNATVLNQKGGLIVGDVTAESGGNSSFINSVTMTTYTPVGVGTQVTTYTASGNWSGGTALVDNSGNIGGYSAGAPNYNSFLIGGNVWSSGYTAGLVINRAGAAILGDASADSSRMNYSISAMSTVSGGATTTSSFTENVSWVGGVASLDNFGFIGGNADAGQLGFVTNFSTSSEDSWGGVSYGNLTNEQGAKVGGFVSANSLFIGVNNVNGNVSSPLYGGFANVVNKGIVGEGFYVTSLKGSTFVNAASAQVNAYGDFNSFMLTVNGTNSFTNYGTIGNINYGNGTTSSVNALNLYVNALLGSPSENSVIEFSGNTTAVNYGIITSDVVFTNVDQGELNPGNVTATANFTFGQGSILTGDVNDLQDVPVGATYANLTINFSGASGIPGNATSVGGGIYQGNIWYATATNVTAGGRWILTGQNLYLGQTTINNPNAGGAVAWLEIGTPLNYLLNNPGQLLDVVIGANMDPLQGLDPFYGNSAVNPAVNSVSSTLTSNLISAIKDNPIITGNISIGTNGGLEGQAIIVGGVSNSGFLLPGWMLPNNTSSTLVNLIANTNQVLPGQFEISGNFTQSSTGTFLTNFAPTINRPVAQFVGTQAGPFAPVSFWLSVSPFQQDHTPSGSIVVDGTATMNGTVQVYVNTSGLYVNGDSRTIVYDVGNLTLGANVTTTQTFASPFVHFGLNTGNATVTTVAGTTKYNTVNVVVQRTSYSTVATNANAAAVGVALDNAVPQVANEISGANGFVFANMTQFNNAQDMAGFLSDLDWRSGNVANAAAILNDVTPSGYAAVLAIDTGAGFENQVNKHLLDNRGAGAQGDPLASAFIQAYGMNQRVNTTDAAHGIAGDTAGLAAGLDFQLTDDFTLGAAMGWSNTSLNGNQNFGGGLNAIQAGLYSTITMGEFYLDMTVWENFVHGSMDRSEPLIDRSFNASYRDNELRADAELGYRFNFADTPIDNLGVTPFVGFNYRNVDLGNFTENATQVSSLEVPDGALGVTVKSLNHDILQPYIGVTADGLYRISPMVVVKPMIGINVGFGDSANSILAEFEGGGSAFAVRGPQSNSAWIAPEAGLEFSIGPTYSLSFSYRGQYGGHYDEQGGWLTLRGTW